MKEMTCFLIDDDEDDQEIFELAVLNVNSSATCVFANNCIEAIEKLESDKNFIPHCIFIDINMPRLNGIDCLKAIKKIDRLSHLPVFMYSTSADPGIISQSKELGATDFIVKPTNIKDLTDTLSHLFHN